MSERHKPHNGRDLSGHFKVKQEDLDELLEDPKGPDFVRDDVRLGGAVEDIGINAGRHGKQIEERIRDSEDESPTRRS